MIKKILILLIVMSLVFLSACGTKDNDNSISGIISTNGSDISGTGNTNPNDLTENRTGGTMMGTEDALNPTNTNGSVITNGSQSNSSSTTGGKLNNSTDFGGLKLESYVRPTDINYDLSPLPLNKKLSFITRKVDKLYEDGKEFRFISANAPTLLDSSAWEQEDLVKTIAQMGGRVSRTYTFSVSPVGGNAPGGAFILGKGKYNEAAFKRLDQLLVLCNKYGVRLIIPFMDPYIYNGGIPAFNDFFGKRIADGDGDSLVKNAAVFYSDSAIKAEFYNFVKHVVSRKNSISGVYYKDDPAILAWESGNELPYYNEASPYYNGWIKELGALIKSIDKNHLFVDGASFGTRAEALNDNNIDIVNFHLYPNTIPAGTTFESELKNYASFAKGKKVSICGEFGFIKTAEVEKFYNAIIASNVSGSLFWSIRQHSERGGFIQHQENDTYKSYHWPGFDSGAKYEEKSFLRLSYLMAHKIKGDKPRLIGVPSVPEIISPINNSQVSILWKGSTGAYGYDIQRSETANGPWITIGVNVIDDTSGAVVYFADSYKGLVKGKTYYYRMRARSAGGYSDWSAPVAGVARKTI